VLLLLCAQATQFITHTTGRMLAQLNPVSTPINTVGYESLLGLVGTTTVRKTRFSSLVYTKKYDEHFTKTGSGQAQGNHSTRRHFSQGDSLDLYCGAKNATLFFEFFLCLSRACLGKMIVFIYNWHLKNGGFRRSVLLQRELKAPAGQA
jgi:hypothetical protein